MKKYGIGVNIGNTGCVEERSNTGSTTLRYDNPNSRGMNFIKFDGIRVENGTTYLIDAKRNIPYWIPEAMEGYKNTFERINKAKLQNPGIKIIYEFPKEEAKIKFTDWLDRNPGYQNIIDEIRVRPEK